MWRHDSCGRVSHAEGKHLGRSVHPSGVARKACLQWSKEAHRLHFSLLGLEPKGAGAGECRAKEALLSQIQTSLHDGFLVFCCSESPKACVWPPSLARSTQLLQRWPSDWRAQVSRPLKLANLRTNREASIADKRVVPIPPVRELDHSVLA